MARLQGLVSRLSTPSRLNIRYQVLIFLRCWLSNDTLMTMMTPALMKAKLMATCFVQGLQGQELATSPTGRQVALMEGLHHQNITIVKCSKNFKWLLTYAIQVYFSWDNIFATCLMDKTQVQFSTPSSKLSKWPQLHIHVPRNACSTGLLWIKARVV